MCVCRCADVAAVERWGLGLRQLVSAASVPGRPVHAVLKPLCSLTAHHALLRVYTPHALSRTAQAQTLPPLHASPLVLRQQRPFHAQRPSSPIPRFHAYTLMRPYTHAREGTHAHPRWYAEVSAPACFRARAPTSKRFMSMPKHSPPPTEACMTCMQPLGCTADPRSTFPPTLLVTHTQPLGNTVDLGRSMLSTWCVCAAAGEHHRPAAVLRSPYNARTQTHATTVGSKVEPQQVYTPCGACSWQLGSTAHLQQCCTPITMHTWDDWGAQRSCSSVALPLQCTHGMTGEHSVPAAVLHSPYNAHMG